MLFECGRRDTRILDILVKKGVVGRYIENIVRKSPRVFVDKLDILTEENN